MNTKLEPGKILNIPNILSISRLVLLPLILFLIATKQYYTALVFMIISWITDAADGYIARKTNQVTNIGKVLDHFVDKIWIGTILVALVITRGLPWWIAGPVILRDILIVIGSVLIIQKRSYIYSSPILGKITGFFFAVMIVMYLLDFTHVDIVRNILLAIVSILIIVSFAYYIYRYVKAIRNNHPDH
jgi:CDP-diacylglycerol--glycerol-3-phosphate 3-phosphatidyltransferase